MKVLLPGRSLPASPDPDIRAEVLLSSSRTVEEPIELDIADDEVVEIETEDGDRLLIRGDELAERLSGITLLKRSGAAGTALLFPRELILDVPPELADPAQTRGQISWVIRRIVVHGPKVTTAKLAREWEEKDSSPGLKSWSSNAALTPVQGQLRPASQQQNQPWLLFLHGTGSSTLGSFGDLTQQTQTWSALHQTYPDRILVFDHRSLTEDPVQNTLRLLDQLPTGLELHLVSHSRGGLIGELLSLGHLAEHSGDTVLRPADLDRFTGEAFERLAQLGRTLARRKIRITRFVRVACPIRGTQIADGRLGDWLGLLFNSLAHSIRLRPASQPNSINALARISAAALAGRDSPDALPGIAAMAPGFSPLLGMLNDSSRKLRDDTSDNLVVIGGDLVPTLSVKKLLMFFVDSFFGTDNDLVVNTSLMEGGLPRPDPTLLIDRSPVATHFRYFENPLTVRQLRDGLLAPATLRGIDPPSRQLIDPQTSASDGPALNRELVQKRDDDEADLQITEIPAAPAVLRGGPRHRWR